VPGVPLLLLLGFRRPLLGVLLGELMSGVPGVLGTPGVDGLLMDEPLLLPGAPTALTPKCELICCAHDESIVGQLLAVNVGALCNLLWSTLSVNWSAPLSCTRLHGTATRFALDDVDPSPLLELVPIPERVDELLLVPMPLEVELLVPGAPADVLLNESTTNSSWPELGSTMMSCTEPSDCPVWPRMFWCISLLKRTGLFMEELVLLPAP
jgi:hypothetical protein